MGNIISFFFYPKDITTLRGVKIWPAFESLTVQNALTTYLSGQEADLAKLVSDLVSLDSIENGKKVQVLNEILSFLNPEGNYPVDVLQLCKPLWNTFFKRMLAPKTALVLVDVQNDFITGSLALKACPAKEDGEEIVPVINRIRLQNQFDVVALTKDWHPQDHCSFASNVAQHPTVEERTSCEPFEVLTLKGPPAMKQVMWPDHCVQNTVGAEIHKDLIVEDSDYIVNKGVHVNVDSYSGFRDNEPEALSAEAGANILCKGELGKILVENQIDEVYLAGLATDVCVNATTRHSLQAGFTTLLIEEGCRGVEGSAIEKTKCDLAADGVSIIHDYEVLDFVNRSSRVPPVQLALNYIKNKRRIEELETLKSQQLSL